MTMAKLPLDLYCGSGKSLKVTYENMMAGIEISQPAIRFLAAGPTAEELASMPPEARSYRRQTLERAVDGALEILRTSDQWTQEAGARQADGTPCDPRSGYAQKWCIQGAFRRVVDLLHLDTAFEIPLRRPPTARFDPEFNPYRLELSSSYTLMMAHELQRFIESASCEDHGCGVANWNDLSRTTFEDVRLWLKGLFDRIDPGAAA
jgi:hypothetical protein